MAYSVKSLATTDNNAHQNIGEIEQLELDIAAGFETVQHLGREMLRRRRENITMRGDRAQGPRYLHDLRHIGIRLADRLVSVHAQISKLLALLEKEHLLFSSNEREPRSLTLQYIERMERSLRRWDNIRYRLTVH